MLYTLDNMSAIPLQQLSVLTEDDFEKAQDMIDIANKLKSKSGLTAEELSSLSDYVGAHSNSNSKLHRFTAACINHALKF